MPEAGIAAMVEIDSRGLNEAPADIAGCRFLPHVSWVVEARCLLIVDGATGNTHRVLYPQAAIWDFISRGYPPATIIGRMSAIAHLTPHAAQTMVRQAVMDWIRDGLLGCL